jgi:outer membrane protein TolC
MGGRVQQGVAAVVQTMVVLSVLLCPDALLASNQSGVAELLRDVVENNPDLQAARARARAAASSAPQAAALPDPTVGASLYLLPPETRAGPQRLTASFSQKLPWKGKLPLREQQAVLEADALQAQADALALEKITQARKLLLRIAFLDESLRIVKEDRETLVEFERLSRARYAAGRATTQAVVKLQAEITRDDARTLSMRAERAGLIAELNALRDRPGSTDVPAMTLTNAALTPLERARLAAMARERRPEMAAARARLEAAEVAVQIARKDTRPDVTVGLTYSIVENRQDIPGGEPLPPDSGDDILGVGASLNLPIYRRRLDAGIQEAVDRREAAELNRRAVASEIDRELEDLLQRIPLIRDQYRLLDTVLLPQSEESLNSLTYAYETGRSEVLDLLDAERVLLEVRLGSARALTDLHLAMVELERTVGGELEP